MLKDTRPIIKPIKSYKQLRISKGVYEGLILVRDKLRSGEIPAKRFTMSYWWIHRSAAKPTECGSAGCIGGWIEHYTGVDASHQYRGIDTSHYRATALDALFYPEHPKAFRASRKKAAEAIDNYLTGAKDPWKGVVN